MVPFKTPEMEEKCSSTSLSSALIWRAFSSQNWPSGVSFTGEALRSKRGTPYSSFSSFLMAELSAGWVMYSRWAALEKLPSWLMARTYS